VKSKRQRAARAPSDAPIRAYSRLFAVIRAYSRLENGNSSSLSDLVRSASCPKILSVNTAPKKNIAKMRTGAAGMAKVAKQL
jgi:hypothetical protein